MAGKERQQISIDPAKRPGFWEKVNVRAFFLSKRDQGRVGNPQDAHHVQAENEQRLVKEIHGTLGRTLRKVVGSLRKDAKSIQAAADSARVSESQAKSSAERSEEGAKRSEHEAVTSQGAADRSGKSALRAELAKEEAKNHADKAHAARVGTEEAAIGSAEAAARAKGSEEAAGISAVAAHEGKVGAETARDGAQNSEKVSAKNASKAQSSKDIAGNHAKAAKGFTDRSEAGAKRSEDAAKNSKTLFDRRIGPAVDASVKPKTRAIGRKLGEVIGKIRENKERIDDLAGKTEEALQKSNEALTRPIPAGERGGKGDAGSKGRIPRWMAPALIGLAALAIGGYFFPRSCADGNEIPQTPTPRAAAGTPTPRPTGTPELIIIPTATARPTPTETPTLVPTKAATPTRVPEPTPTQAPRPTEKPWPTPTPEPTSTPTPRPTPTEAPTPTRTPEIMSDFRTGIPVPNGSEVLAGRPAIVREIDWNTNEVWIYWNNSFPESFKVGPGVIHNDGNRMQVRDAWTAEGQGQWSSIAQEALNEARNIQRGSLGRTGMTIHFMIPTGGFGSVPNSVN